MSGTRSKFVKAQRKLKQSERHERRLARRREARAARKKDPR